MAARTDALLLHALTSSITDHSVLRRRRLAASSCCAPHVSDAAAAPVWPRSAKQQEMLSAGAHGCSANSMPGAAAAQFETESGLLAAMHTCSFTKLMGFGINSTRPAAAQRARSSSLHDAVSACRHAQHSSRMHQHDICKASVRQALQACACAPRWARTAARRSPPWRRWRARHSGRP